MIIHAHCVCVRMSEGAGEGVEGEVHSIRKGIQVLSTLTFPPFPPPFPSFPLPFLTTSLVHLLKYVLRFVCLSTCVTCIVDSRPRRPSANQRIPTTVPYTTNNRPSPLPFPMRAHIVPLFLIPLYPFSPGFSRRHVTSLRNVPSSLLSVPLWLFLLLINPSLFRSFKCVSFSWLLLLTSLSSICPPLFFLWCSISVCLFFLFSPFHRFSCSSFPQSFLIYLFPLFSFSSPPFPPPLPLPPCPPLHFSRRYCTVLLLLLGSVHMPPSPADASPAPLITGDPRNSIAYLTHIIILQYTTVIVHFAQ